MLDIARHARSGKAGHLRRGVGQGGDLDEPGDPGGGQARFERRQQLGDSRLRRVGPLGLGDEVDLASVQSLSHDLHAKASLPQPRGGDVGGNRERLLLRGRGHPAMEQDRAVAPNREDLGSAVQAQVEAAGPLRPGSELRVDVVDIGAAHDRGIEPCPREPLDHPTQFARVRAPVGHGGAVPVEQRRLEAARQRGG